MKLFLSPHNDDETLFGAFTIMRESPMVCVVYDSYVQPSRGISGCTAQTRRQETRDAYQIIAKSDYDQHSCQIIPKREYDQPIFLGCSDLDQVTEARIILGALVLRLSAVFQTSTVSEVWAPAFEIDGHEHHNIVASAADIVFPGIVTHYLTYTRTNGKSRSELEVKPRSGEEIARKLRALACYKSQLQIIDRLGCWPHFMNDLKEYYVA